MSILKALWKDESGQGLVETAILISLITLVCFLAVQTLGISLSARYTKIATDFPG
jgi:Flp pilus assembly pilin Flp